MFTIKINKGIRKRNKILLTYLVKEILNLSNQTPPIESIDAIDSKKFIINYKDGNTSGLKKKVIVKDLPEDCKQGYNHLINSYFDLCCTEAFNEYYNENFKLLVNEAIDYYSKIFPKLTISIINSKKRRINVDFKEPYKELSNNIDVHIKAISSCYDDNYQISFEKTKKTLISLIKCKIYNQVLVYNSNLFNRRKQEFINTIINKICYRLKKEYPTWNFNKESMSFNDKKTELKFKENYNILDDFHESLLHCETTTINDFFKIWDYSFSYYDENNYIQHCVDIFKQKFINVHIKQVSIPNKYINENKQIKHIYNEFNKNAYAILNKCHNQPLTFSCYVKFPETSIIYVEGSLIKGTIKDGKINFEILDKYKSLMEEFKSKKYLNCLIYYNNLLKELKLELNYISGKGLLYGTTTCCINNEKNNTITIEIPSYKDSITIWKKTLKSILTKITKEHHKRKEQELNEFRIQNITLIESFIVNEIYKLIKENEEYITANMVAQAIKKRKITSSYANIKYTNNCGKFDLYTNDEILFIINRLIDNKCIGEKAIKGTYGEFNILKLKNFTKYLSTYNVPLKNIIDDLNANKSITDFNCITIFSNIKNKKNKDLSDYLLCLQLINNKGFICLYKNDFLNIFKNASQEIKDFIKMKIELEEDRYKNKIFKQIEKSIVC